MNMKKRIITTVAALATMTVGTAFAQDKVSAVAGVPVVELNNGSQMPQFGLGTYLQPSDDVCWQSCLAALKAGYRHIDTAHAYNDERGLQSPYERGDNQAGGDSDGMSPVCSAY